jgi:hypothetical protein
VQRRICKKRYRRRWLQHRAQRQQQQLLATTTRTKQGLVLRVITRGMAEVGYPEDFKLEISCIFAVTSFTPSALTASQQRQIDRRRVCRCSSSVPGA